MDKLCRHLKKSVPLRRAIVFVLCFLFVFLLISSCHATDTDKLRQELINQINQLQNKINGYQGNIKETQEQAKSLQGEISILENQISSIKLEIKQIDLTIVESSLNIKELDGEIDNLQEQIYQKQYLLAEYYRIIDEYDNETLFEIILKKDNLSDFFDEVNALENTQEAIKGALENIRGLRMNLAQQKDKLEIEQEEQYRLRYLQETKKRSVAYQQDKKEDLLKETKGQEKIYQERINDTEKDIAFIREQLSLLDKYDITLEEAIQNAIFAASKTGIRPAFLLGVLEAESRLGLNVGTGNWKKDMYQCYQGLAKYYGNSYYLTKAEKEKNAFFQICQELNLNPNSQPVSAEPYYGCGGAMGVAQFMPTTWMAYRDRVAGLVGHSPSPWNHKDAFTAAAIKLADGGATARTERGEREAYSKYLAGSRWQGWMYSNETNRAINLANNFQQQYFD